MDVAQEHQGQETGEADPQATKVAAAAGFITGQVIYNTGGQHRPIGRAG